MTIQRLSKLKDWQVRHAHQDIRGHKVYRRTDTCVGTVTDMVVDTTTRVVTSVVLDDGRHIAAEDLTDDQGVIYLDGQSRPTSGPPPRTPGARRSPGPESTRS